MMSPKDYYTISEADFLQWLRGLSPEREIFYPVRRNGDWVFRRWEGEGPLEIEPSGYRAVESLKNFLFPARVEVARFPRGEIEGKQSSRDRVIVGLKACDLACLPVLDYIFKEGDFSDPFYARSRESTILISQDCLEFKEVCFCPVVGGQPYPLSGFDLNLTPLPDGYLVESGSDRGNRLLEENRDFFKPAAPEQLKDREKLRSKVLTELKKQLEEQGQIEEAPSAAEVRNKSADELWKEESVPCVECGACNLVCPTCHCFILEELASASGSLKIRNWDACQYPGFSRVAGGANPRSRRSERLSNRFSKKFEFFPEVTGVIACTGCGRCFEACMGKIDIRKILKRIKCKV